LAKLKEVVDSHCPVLDILRAPVPVELELAAVPVAAAALADRVWVKASL
jgi:hypothetical protein